MPHFDLKLRSMSRRSLGERRNYTRCGDIGALIPVEEAVQICRTCSVNEDNWLQEWPTDHKPHSAPPGKTAIEKERVEAERPTQKPRSVSPGKVATNDVFISCKLNENGVQTRDAKLAAEVYNFLTAKGLRVFLSDFTLEELGESDYADAINSALESASVLLAIGTSANHLKSNWVKYEWKSFSTAILSGYKPNGKVFTYIEGMRISDLPWALQQTQTLEHSETSLQRLYNFINNALQKAVGS